MRVDSILGGALAIAAGFATTARAIMATDQDLSKWFFMDDSQFIEDWDDNGRKCLERARRGGPLLFPGEKKLDRAHHNLFRNLVEHILEIHDEFEKDTYRHLGAMRDSTKQWKKIHQCLPHYKLIRVEELTDGFISLRDVGMKLRKLRYKDGAASIALADDLLVYVLRLVGFLNNEYSTTEVPEWLVDSPGQAVGSLLSYVSFDITQCHGCTMVDRD